MNDAVRFARPTRGAFVVVAVALFVFGAAACEPQRAAPVHGPWAPYGARPGQPYYATRGPDPYTMPGGSEALDPWSARPSPAASPPTAATSTGQDAASSFLILTTLQGPSASEREPAVNALIARLGGVRRAPSLWEVTSQPGGGLGSVAAALESELCAEDVVVIYRARGQGMERSEFAGHKTCAALPPVAVPVVAPRLAAPPPAASTPRKPPVDPLRTRF